MRSAFAVRRSLSTSAEPLSKTALYELHKELGGKMVPFAGYELPVQVNDVQYLNIKYKLGLDGCSNLYSSIIKSHCIVWVVNGMAIT